MSDEDPKLLDRITARRNSIEAESGILPPLESEQDEIARLKQSLAEFQTEPYVNCVDIARKLKAQVVELCEAADALARAMRRLTDAVAKAREGTKPGAVDPSEGERGTPESGVRGGTT